MVRGVEMPLVLSIVWALSAYTIKEYHTVLYVAL